MKYIYIVIILLFVSLLSYKLYNYYYHENFIELHNFMSDKAIETVKNAVKLNGTPFYVKSVAKGAKFVSDFDYIIVSNYDSKNNRSMVYNRDGTKLLYNNNQVYMEGSFPMTLDVNFFGNFYSVDNFNENITESYENIINSEEKKIYPTLTPPSYKNILSKHQEYINNINTNKPNYKFTALLILEKLN